MLAPDNRTLYGEVLRPPAGYLLDQALATTYTLDFETALVVPATMAFHAAENRQDTLESPLALLEGLERLSSKIAIFCEAGRIKAMPKQGNRLTALLENTVTEVLAPRGGAFHPKLWVLRFAPIDTGPTFMRLALLSRNLTADQSWDLSLVLDGEETTKRNKANQPIMDLVAALPSLATGGGASAANRAISQSLTQSLSKTSWQHPEHILDISFAVNGITDAAWAPQMGRSVGIISPFVTDEALQALTEGAFEDQCYLWGRQDELSVLAPETLDKFEHVLVLDDMAETEDGEETTPDARTAHSRNSVPARGLHAKAFFTEHCYDRRWHTEVTIGSGNATRAALLPSKGDGTGTANVEVFATLSGLRRNLGRVQDQFSPDLIGRYLQDFMPHTSETTDTDAAVERTLDRLRKTLAQAGLTLRCSEVPGDRIALLLSSQTPLHVPETITLSVWPLIIGVDHSRTIRSLDQTDLPLCELALVDVTRWIGVRLEDKASGILQEFTLGTDLRDLPENRTAQILKSVIQNKSAFLNYIRLLLGDVSDAGKALMAAGSGGAGEGTFTTTQDRPLLEDLVRALSGDKKQLHEIERLMARLVDPDTGKSDVIPAEFQMLWASFRQVMESETT